MTLPTFLRNDCAVMAQYARECCTPSRAFPDRRIYLAALRIAAISLLVIGTVALFVQSNLAKGAIGTAVLLGAAAFGIPQPGNPQQPSAEPRFNTPETWSREERIKLAHNTLAYLAYGVYRTAEQHAVYFQKGNQLAARSQFVLPQKETFHAKNNHYLMRIIVEDKDCLEMAQTFVEEGHKTAVVNFANPEAPGGSFLDGARAQEEQICFRSELAGMMEFLGKDRKVYPTLYKFKEHFGGSIHTPDVLVFREGEAKDFALLNDPFKVGILTSAAPELPDTKKVDEKITYKNEKTKQLVKAAIRTQLHTAYEQGYEAIVLGAFGCGVFMNPPDAVAELYHEVLSQEFKGAFKRVGFAIIDAPPGSHNPTGNLKPFQDRFPNSTI